MTSHSFRLDSRFPLVWRSPTAAQIGVDTARVRFDSVSRTEERMLHALRVGVAIDGLRMLAQGSGTKSGENGSDPAVRFLKRLEPVLDARRASPFRAARIDVEGDSPAAASLRRLFAQLVGQTGVPPALDSEPDVVVIVSAWAVRPTVSARWLNRDIVHLPVVFSDHEARIGPLVTPGDGPCLHCVERWAIERDPAWPAIASQLLGRKAPTEQPLLVASVTAITARLVRSHLSGDGRGLRSGAVIHVNAETGVVTETPRSVHPECGCRVLAESVTEPGSATGRRPFESTRGQAVAVRV
ncbi:MAG: hypothetical protein JWQ19_738 [Subtercola sp.]|nr:hypothetical protein [Subtercola sp.]